MNYYYNNNFWVYINSKDPEGQLEWLVQILQDSENTNEKVTFLFILFKNSSNCLTKSN